MKLILGLLLGILPALVWGQPSSQPSSQPATRSFGLSAGADDGRTSINPPYLTPVLLAGVGAAGLGLTYSTITQEDFALGVEEEPAEIEFATAAASIARTSLSAALLTAGLARYQKTQKIRTLYTVTALSALHAAGRGFFTYANALASGGEVTSYALNVLVHSGVVGVLAASAATDFLLIRTLLEVHYRRYGR